MYGPDVIALKAVHASRGSRSLKPRARACTAARRSCGRADRDQMEDYIQQVLVWVPAGRACPC